MVGMWYDAPHMWICIAPHHEHTFESLSHGTRSRGISQFYLHTSYSSANGMNHIYPFLPSQRWFSFTDHRGMEGWVGLGSKLHTRINVRHWGLNQDTVTHLNTNWAQRMLTLLIETNMSPLLSTARWATWSSAGSERCIVVIMLFLISIKCIKLTDTVMDSCDQCVC